MWCYLRRARRRLDRRRRKEEIMNPSTTEPFVDFSGRRLVVTGASSGIGRAIAVELGRRGAHLVLMGRDAQRLEETARLTSGVEVDVLALDLREAAAAAAAVREVVARRGRLAGLCHCAGVVETLPLSALRLDSFRAMFEVNVTAGLELARTVTRRDCLEEAGGAILFVSSIYASVGQAGQIGYSASKGALLAAARAMAVELARRKIRVNTISPGLVHTPLADAALAKLDPQKLQALEAAHPLGSGTPEDVARAAAFLLAPQNRWITGIDLVIDGGYTAQ